MNADPSVIGAQLSQLIFQNNYLYFLFRLIAEVGIEVEGIKFSLTYDSSSGKACLKLLSDTDQIAPAFWARCDSLFVEALVNNGQRTSDLSIETGPKGLNSDAIAIRLLQRCFEMPPYPIDDREELIYPALFGCDPPRLVWQSPESLLRVLQYQDSHGDSFSVSSGFSEPWAWQTAPCYDASVSGAGYELAIKTRNSAVVDEFASWVRYIEDTQRHIVVDNWLEFENGMLIPGTDVAGFLVVTPAEFLSYFPVGDLVAHWHYLVPVNVSQLRLAKRTSVSHVAEMIGQNSAESESK